MLIPYPLGANNKNDNIVLGAITKADLATVFFFKDYRYDSLRKEYNDRNHSRADSFEFKVLTPRTQTNIAQLKSAFNRINETMNLTGYEAWVKRANNK